ncbi:MAG: molybdopterin molybdenumtransferase MoeA [Rhodobacteraceae bacterium]|nr:molybdopterin molybdenumtransferase MoeA [Paracoccaceae bacterium]
MTSFDTIIIVDWSGGNQTRAKPRKDAIWVGMVTPGRPNAETFYFRNRHLVENWLTETLIAERKRGHRVFAGFDFPFAYPRGFGRVLTGSDDPFAVWNWLTDKVVDEPKHNNRFELGGEMNAMFPGVGPFWFHPRGREIENLPAKGKARIGHGMEEFRTVEKLTKGTFSCWQLGGPGTVGGQVIMGLPVLNRLRRRFANDVSVWPFNKSSRGIHLVEIWPSLISDAVDAQMTDDAIKDEVQVRVLAEAIARQSPDRIAEWLSEGDPEEGWIFGTGHADELASPPVNTLRNDCFALPPGVDWTPVDEALANLRASLGPVVTAETVPTAQALGRVLATDAIALRANPPAANAAVDGYGFAHASLGDPPHALPLVAGRAAAGAPFSWRVPPGYAVRILTGALLPDDVDTVVLEEDVTVEDDKVTFDGSIKPGANRRRAGEDVDAGDIVLKAGRVLRPSDIALLSATGVGTVSAYRRLRVGVLSTGDELADPAPDTPADRTFDANRPMLLSVLERWGYDAVDLGRAPDDRAVLRGMLDESANRVDAILTSGGASAGDEDHMSALLTEADALSVWRIALKPGRPLALGVWQGVPVFGLPGNPVAALVCTLVFARPALSLLAGSDWDSPQGFTVPAAFSKSKKPGRREFLRARINGDGAVEVFASEGSGRISGLSWADGLVELDDGAREITPGDPVRYIPYGNFGL